MSTLEVAELIGIHRNTIFLWAMIYIYKQHLDVPSTDFCRSLTCKHRKGNWSGKWTSSPLPWGFLASPSRVRGGWGGASTSSTREEWYVWSWAWNSILNEMRVVSKVLNSYLVVIRDEKEKWSNSNKYAYFLPVEVQAIVPVYVEKEQRLGRMRSAPMESSFYWSTWSKLVASRADNELPRPGEKT